MKMNNDRMGTELGIVNAVCGGERRISALCSVAKLGGTDTREADNHL